MKSPKKGQPLSAVAILKNSFFLNEHVFTSKFTPLQKIIYIVCRSPIVMK